MPPMMKPQHSGKREKADFKSFGRLLAYCKSYLPVIITAIVLAVGGAVCSIIGPRRIADLGNAIEDGLATGINLDTIMTMCLWLVLIYAVGTFLSYGQQFIMSTVTQNVSKKLRSDINRKINKLPLNYFDTSTTGDILSRVTNDEIGRAHV